MEWEQDPGWQYLRLSLEKLMEEQSKPFNSKTAIWVPDKDEGFLLGDIKGEKGDTVTVFVKGAEQTYKKDQLQEVNPPKFAMCEDISTMSFLNEASVLSNLRDRYQNMLIYTYSGLFCVVINPYKRLPIYTDSVARIYMGKRKTEIPPHLFAASDEAYRNMLQDNQCQSMLITGESGAGKTENTKKVISYFASVGAKQAEEMGIVKKAGAVSLEDQIVQTNPVLEAFGNAKTVRNNNSSRFGKFIRIHFSKDGRVAACDIEHYLLEKSRVIRQAPGERAYHIFYQIMSGQNPELKKQLSLDKEPKDYWYVNQAETTIPGVDDKEEFALTDEAFDILNFSKDEKQNVYRLCSAITHMGEMAFKQRGEQAEPDGKDEANKSAVNFGVNGDALLTAFCKPRVKVGTEWVNKGQTAEQVNWAKGAMSKAIFDRLFDWLVLMCNKTLDGSDLARVYFVGVLDIAGFEIFDFNSFEQLWINFVNEKLQQFFNHHMFVLEQEEYQKEGIVWQFIDFGLDLAAGIELLEKPMGVISSLDEECVVPKGSDLSYAQKLNDMYLGKHPKFEKPKPPKGKQAEAHFALVQYAGTVRYNVSNWLEKNKDPLNDTVAGVLKNSIDNELIKTIWADYQTQEERAAAEKAGGGGGGGKKKGKSGSSSTVSMKYRQSLENLMHMLHSTHPHFIRCLIPNELKKSGLLAAELVMNQLTCNGVLEGIRICRKGFPNRMYHVDFKQRYAILAADAAKADASKGTSDAMMAAVVKGGALTEEDFRVGLTKVFFKAGILAKMEELREFKLSSYLKLLQAEIRSYTAITALPKRKAYVQAQLTIKNNVRSWTEVRTWSWFQLLGRVKGMFETMREQARMAAIEGLYTEAKARLEGSETTKKAFQDAIEQARKDKEETLTELEATCGGFREAEMKISELVEARVALSEELESLTNRLRSAESEFDEMTRASHNMEGETANFKAKISNFEKTVKSLEKSNKERDGQIAALEAETSAQADAQDKLKKEVATLSEVNNKLNDDFRSLEEKVETLSREKSETEKNLNRTEDGMKKEKRERSEVDAARRKAETELMLVMQKIEELLRAQSEWDQSLKRKGQELQTLDGYLMDERQQSARLQEQIANIGKAVRVKF